jgi:hypothetical protein
MSKDDFDKKEFEDRDGPVERDTEVTSPPESLIDKSRRSSGVLIKEDLAAAPTQSDPQSREAVKPKPGIQSRSPSLSSVSIRMGSTSAPVRKTGKTMVVIAVGLAAFLLGFLPINIYHESQQTALQTDLSDSQEQLDMCSQNAERCVDELSGCVRDFETLSSSAAPLGLAPRDFLVEKKREKKEFSAQALSQKQEELLSRLDAMNKPKARSGKRWKELQNDVTRFRDLIVASKIADKEYQSALKTSITPAVGAADVELTTRNRKRAAYLKEARSILAGPSTDLDAPTP